MNASSDLSFVPIQAIYFKPQHADPAAQHDLGSLLTQMTLWFTSFFMSHFWVLPSLQMTHTC